MKPVQAPPGRLLALDVGSRRIGVALSDELGMIATPLEVIHHSSKADDMARIAATARQHQVAAILVGHPLNEDGSAGPQARYVEQVAAQLETVLHQAGIDVPVILWDEYGSTRRAQQAMIETGRGARDRRARLDAVAAAAILQDYLDAHRPPPSIPPPPERYSGSPEDYSGSSDDYAGRPDDHTGSPEAYSGSPDEW